MKFIAKKGAPDIPLKLIEAQEDDRLVFFCGAGVSYPAGLPDFSGLVDNIYSSLPEEKDDLEAQAIKSDFYDRALGLLERRVGKALVREQIISQLEVDSSSNLETHRAIIQLSKTKLGNYRLVTTNVDHGFVIAGDDLDLQCDAAPKLPVAKRHKLKSIVHLHGLVDKINDPGGDNLVFTSGDFGSAYLTERWASKFVTDLFVNFTVVFVGYSVNDPVIRYMTDAIAAEQRQGDELFNRPYVIAATTPSNTERSVKEWEAKGVDPILYVSGGKNHPNLHNSLKAWAAHSRDGLGGKQKIIKTKAVIEPVPPYDSDESIQQVIDTIKEKTEDSDREVTGHPAKVFSELESPPASLEWLKIFEKEGLLSLAAPNNGPQISSFDPVGINLVRPNEISFHLWRWLLKHLVNDDFILWIIDKGVCLHPQFLDMVSREIRGESIGEPYLTFWRVVTSGHVSSGHRIPLDGSDVIVSLTKGLDNLNKLAFAKLIEPAFKLSKSFYWAGDDEDAEDETKIPYSVEVEVGLQEWVFDQLVESDIYPLEMIDILPVVSQSLLTAIDLLSSVEKADDKNDLSTWEIISIEPHEQNHRHSGISHLIEMCRDLWLALFEVDEEKAALQVLLWKSYRYPVFRRLCIHAHTAVSLGSTEQVLDYLLEDNGWWLWSICTTREVYRLLAKMWAGLSIDQADRLLGAIVIGPPRNMFRDDLTDDDFSERRDRERWLMLAKLESFGRALHGEAANLLLELSDNYPKWRLQGGERDEFNSWFSTSVGNDSDITVEKLFLLPAAERVDLLSKDDQRFGDGRIDVFRYAGKDNAPGVVETLRYVFGSTLSLPKVWHAGLTGLAEGNYHAWLELAPLIVELPDELYAEEAWAIAWWLRKAVSKIEVNSAEEEYCWSIVNRHIELNGSVDIDLDDEDDAVGKAINNPVGIMTEAILDRLNLHKVERNSGLPEPQPLSILNAVCDGVGGGFLLGRVILCSRLSYFYSVDQSWAQDKIIPLLDLDANPEAVAYWQGYLWAPRITADLAIDLKSSMLLMLERNVLMGRDLEGLVKIFTFTLIQYPDMYKKKEVQLALRGIGVQGLSHAAEMMSDMLSGDNNIDLWVNRVKPVVDKLWPKGRAYMGSELSKQLVSMAINTGDKFPDAMALVSPMLTPIDDRYLVYKEILDSDCVDNFPRLIFKLLSVIFRGERDFDGDLLGEIVDRLEVADASLADEPKIREMKDLLMLREI